MPRRLTPESIRPDVRRWTGISALAVAALMATEFLVEVLTVGTTPPLSDAKALGAFTAHAANATLVVIFIDTFLMAALLVFLASFRQLIVHTRADMRWVADIGFGAGLVFVALTLVGDAMDGGGALDTVYQTPDGVVIRALTEGHLLLFGAIGSVMTALIIAAAGYIALATTVLPRWSAWAAFVIAISNLITVPSMFNGSSPTDPFSAGGPGVTALATFPFLAWVALVGLLTIRGHPHHQRRLAARAARLGEVF